MPLYKALICGDRKTKMMYSRIVIREIRKLKKKHGVTNLLIIEGGANGVDTIAGYYGKLENVHVAEIPALWDTRGRGAGPQRNKVMAALEPDEVIGIHSDISESKGTKDMLKLAESLGIPTRLVDR